MLLYNLPQKRDNIIYYELLSTQKIKEALIGLTRSWSDITTSAVIKLPQCKKVSVSWLYGISRKWPVLLIINCGLTPHSYFTFSCSRQSAAWSELPFSPSIPPAASTRYHVKLLWEQLQLCSISPVLFLTSGDIVTVDLSSPIKVEVSHISASGCQHPSLF